MFFVKSGLDVRRDQVDDRGGSGVGLRAIGCPIYGETPGWFGRLEPVTKIVQMIWKPWIEVWHDEDGEMVDDERQSSFV